MVALRLLAWNPVRPPLPRRPAPMTTTSTARVGFFLSLHIQNFFFFFGQNFKNFTENRNPIPLQEILQPLKIFG
jgi:hypothetical protein